MRVEKSVFICYRRANYHTALAVFQHLEAHGYDVFLDYKSIPSGDWRQFILKEISARAHFLIILTPSMLERCINPDDVTRMEIEHAIAQKRNVIPLFFEGFKFSAATDQYLSPAMKALPNYNGTNIYDDLFDASMERLRTQFLSRPLQVVLQPVSAQAQAAAADLQRETRSAPAPTDAQRKAEVWYERGFADYVDGRHNDALEAFARALSLKPDHVEALYWRGHTYRLLDRRDDAINDWMEALAHTTEPGMTALLWSNVHRLRGNFVRALKEADKAVVLQPTNVDWLRNRGNIRADAGDYDGAIADFNEALRLNPSFALAYSNRGLAWLNKGEYDRAIADFNEAIRLNPSDASAYNNRGRARGEKGDYDHAIDDYNEAIRLNPSYAMAYNNRGVSWNNKGDKRAAIADYEAALRIDPNHALAKQNLERLRKR